MEHVHKPNRSHFKVLINYQRKNTNPVVEKPGRRHIYQMTNVPVVSVGLHHSALKPHCVRSFPAATTPCPRPGTSSISGAYQLTAGRGKSEVSSPAWPLARTLLATSQHGKRRPGKRSAERGCSFPYKSLLGELFPGTALAPLGDNGAGT